MSARRQLAVAPKRRTAPPEERREQLILATIRCVADQGLADTTIATVAQEAGLSQGIVNLHFRSKDGLLTETLRYLADGQVTLNDRCPVRLVRLNRRMEPVWVNGRPVGFC